MYCDQRREIWQLHISRQWMSTFSVFSCVYKTGILRVGRKSVLILNNNRPNNTLHTFLYHRRVVTSEMRFTPQLCPVPNYTAWWQRHIGVSRHSAEEGLEPATYESQVWCHTNSDTRFITHVFDDVGRRYTYENVQLFIRSRPDEFWLSLHLNILCISSKKPHYTEHIPINLCITFNYFTHLPKIYIQQRWLRTSVDHELNVSTVYPEHHRRSIF